MVVVATANEEVSPVIAAVVVIIVVVAVVVAVVIEALEQGVILADVFLRYSALDPTVCETAASSPCFIWPSPLWLSTSSRTTVELLPLTANAKRGLSFFPFLLELPLGECLCWGRLLLPRDLNTDGRLMSKGFMGRIRRHLDSQLLKNSLGRL